MATAKSQKPVETTQLLKEVKSQSSSVVETVLSDQQIYEQKAIDFINLLLEYKNKAYEKGYQYQQIAMDEVNKYKNQAVQKYHLGELKDYTQQQLGIFIAYMESQVQLLKQKYCKEDNVEIKKLTNDSVKQFQFIARVQAIGQDIRSIAKKKIREQLDNFKVQNMPKEAIAQYKLIMQSQKVQETLIFATIATEFLNSLIQTKVLTPSITFYDAKSKQLVQQTKIVIENVQTKVVKKYLPTTFRSYDVLKNSSVYFYENCMTIQFASEFYEKNQAKIVEQVNSLYSGIKEYQENIKVTYSGAYGSALSSYKKKRQEIMDLKKIENLQVVNDVKADGSQLSAKKNE